VFSSDVLALTVGDRACFYAGDEEGWVGEGGGGREGRGVIKHRVYDGVPPTPLVRPAGRDGRGRTAARRKAAGRERSLPLPLTRGFAGPRYRERMPIRRTADDSRPALLLSPLSPDGIGPAE